MKIEVLTEFCELLTIPKPVLVDADTTLGFEVQQDIEAHHFQRLTLELVEHLVMEIGSVLNLTISVPDDVPILEIQGGMGKNLTEALDEIKAREPTAMLRLNIVIAKDRKSQELGLDISNFNVIHFLFKDTFYRFLKESALPDLDHDLFRSASEPTIVILWDGSYVYKGDLFNIVGLENLTNQETTFVPINDTVKGNVTTYLKIAEERLSWIGFRFVNTTPAHLNVSCVRTDDKVLTSLLVSLLLNLSIIFTANRTSYTPLNGSTLLYSWYASSDHDTSLTLGFQDDLELRNDFPLLTFADWILQGRPADRLLVLQNVIARELSSSDTEENFGILISQLKSILDNANRVYRSYTDGKIEKHFDITQSLLEYISGIAKDVASNVDAVTKGLIESLLTTIGVIVATFIALIAKGETQDINFSFLMKAYAYYILAFQLFYRMGSILHSYILLRIDAEKRISRYSKQLYLDDDKLAEIKSPLRARQTQFLVWFIITSFIYVLVFGMILWLSEPQRLIQLNVLNPTATPSAQGSPSAVATQLPNVTPAALPTASLPSPTLVVSTSGPVASPTILGQPSPSATHSP